MSKQRYFLELSYDGTLYHGWQIQPNAVTVQQHVDEVLSTVFRQKVETLGCGRTDAGVHATQFFAHFDLLDQEGTKGDNAVVSINALLPYSIAVKRCFQVAPEAHARFDALERAYSYHIHFKKDPFKLNRSWLFKGTLNVEAMNRAAKMLPNYSDFSCFSKSNTQTFTNNCKIYAIGFTEKEDGALVFKIRADRFLRNMVRAIVGTLIRIGKEEIAPEEIVKIIESKDRSNAGQSVPACGLYLEHVKYPYIEHP